jgi:hypothetical protein
MVSIRRAGEEETITDFATSSSTENFIQIKGRNC